MINPEEIKYSLKNLAERKSRSFLTILSIFLGITTIFIFVSFGLGLYYYVDTVASETGVDKILVQPRSLGAPGLDSTFKLTDDDLDVIEKTSGVKRAAGIYLKVVQPFYKTSSKYVYGMSVEPTTENIKLLRELMTVEVYKGREFKKGDSGKVMLGYNYILDNKIFSRGFDVGDKITINDKKYDIIGIWEQIGNPGDDSNIYLVNKDMEELFPDETLTYGMIIVQVEDYTQIDKIADDLDRALRKSRDQEEGKEDYFVQTYEELIAQFGMVLNIIIGFIVLIALISVVVSAVNTANTMITSVLERTKEIGIMKAIGAKRSVIRNIFLFESSFLGFIAGIIGITFGWIFTIIARNILKNLGWGFLQPLYTWELFVGLIVFATLVGTLSGVIVAIQAAKQNAVDALRYE